MNPRERAVRSAIILTALLLVAWLTADGTTQMLAAAYFPVEPPAAAPSRSRLSGPREREQWDTANAIARRVLIRNIFDSETGSLAWNPPVEPTEPLDEADVTDPTLLEGEPEPCEGSARLVGAMVVPSNPDLSFASIEEGGKAMLYRPGMQVGDAKLVGIREQRVFLQPSAKPLCQMVMFTGDAPPKASTSERKKPTKPKRPRRRSRNAGLSDDELDQGITKNSDTSYTISRGLVDKILGNQAELMRSARIIPYEENGRTVGVKVYGIRRSSVLGRLGMQNGDVLRTINGHDMTSPDSALEAYTRLREASNISLSMLRRGRPQNLEYTIR